MEVTALGAASSLGSEARSDRWPAAAVAGGGLFLLALAAGAVLAPAAPSPLASRLRVHEYFVAHHDAAFNQSLLIHGVAGAALVVLVVALSRMFAGGGARRLVFLVSGLAAAAASFVQLSVVFRIEHHIESGVGVRQTDVLFNALNRAGALKLVLLAVAVAAASSLVPRRLRWIAYVALPVIGLVAVAMVTRLPASHALLFFARA